MRTAATYLLPLGKFCGQCTSDAAASQPSERRDRCDPGAALRRNRTPSGEHEHTFASTLFLACLPSVLPLAFCPL